MYPTGCTLLAMQQKYLHHQHGINGILLYMLNWLAVLVSHTHTVSSRTVKNEWGLPTYVQLGPKSDCFEQWSHNEDHMTTVHRVSVPKYGAQRKILFITRDASKKKQLVSVNEGVCVCTHECRVNEGVCMCTNAGWMSVCVQAHMRTHRCIYYKNMSMNYHYNKINSP